MMLITYFITIKLAINQYGIFYIIIWITLKKLKALALTWLPRPMILTSIIQSNQFPKLKILMLIECQRSFIKMLIQHLLVKISSNMATEPIESIQVNKIWLCFVYPFFSSKLHSHSDSLSSQHLVKRMKTKHKQLSRKIFGFRLNF